MPSHLRLQQTPSHPIVAPATHQPTSPRPTKKARMSLTQTYYVASLARNKLGREAARPDHDLRRLVGSANFLDGLMDELQHAERESEAWLNQSLREAAASRPEEPRHVQWMDSIVEEYDEEDDSSDDDEDSDDEVDVPAAVYSPRLIRSAPVDLGADQEEDDEDAEFDDEEQDDAELSLRRVSSRHSPPDLADDLDSEDSSDEEDDLPASPRDAVLPLTEKERAAIATTALYDLKAQQPPLAAAYAVQDQQQPLIAAC